VIWKWLDAPSKGVFYTAKVKGNFDCTVNHEPEYSKHQLQRRRSLPENGRSSKAAPGRQP